MKLCGLALCFALATGIAITHGAWDGQPKQTDKDHGSDPSPHGTHAALDVGLLKRVESRVLAPTIKPGPARLPDLGAYYWAQNQALAQRIESASKAYESGSRQPYRALTLIAGSAGVGKTFIKQDIFSNDYPDESVCEFDIKELYERWQSRGYVENRPDLYCGNVVLNELLALKPGQPRLMREFLESQTAEFFVIDSLDEVHPDDYLSLLNQIEQFVTESTQPFLHVVVLGRSFAFRNYWQSRNDWPDDQTIVLLTLHPPRLITTGDLMVSSWNYHTWRYDLRWQQSGSDSEKMPFAAYVEWAHNSFPKSVLTRRVEYQPNQNMDPRVWATLESWAQNYPVVSSMLPNLAGNTIIREIAESFALQHRTYDERAAMEAYLEKWLMRQTKSENRPSAAKPEHLDLYMQLLRGVAVRYLQAGLVDANGYFTVRDDDEIEVIHNGQPLRFPVHAILNHSGLKYLEPREPGDTSYRFEPVWLHRLLVEQHNGTIRETLAR